MKYLTCTICSSLIVMSGKSFANTIDDLLLPNTVIQNGCVYQNLGVYNGNFTMIPVYEDAPSECEPGYYLSSSTNKCVICEKNHYCINNVMNACPDDLVSPVGTSDAKDCGKIIRVGEDMMYLTQRMTELPALAVKIEGKVFYAKLTPIDKGEKPMNINTEHSLRTKIDGVEYSIHDNTTKGDE